MDDIVSIIMELRRPEKGQTESEGDAGRAQEKVDRGT